MTVTKIKNIYFAISIVYGIGISLFSATIYLYLSKVGFTISHINIFIAVYWVVSILTEIPAGVMADAFSKKNMAISGTVIRGVGLLVVYLSGGSITLLIIAGIITSLGTSLNSETLSAWVINEINKVDPKYNFEKLFSRITMIGTGSALLFGLIGAQIFGNINLGIPLALGAVVLFLSAFLTVILLKNESKEKSAFSLNKTRKIFVEKFLSSVSFVKNKPSFLLVSFAFFGSAILTTAPIYQWQLFFVWSDEIIISGYIHILICISTIIGSHIASKVILNDTKKLYFFLTANLFIVSFIILSALIDNIIVAVAFFMLHIVFVTLDGIFKYTFLNKIVNDDNRATLLSFVFTIEAIIIVLTLAVNSWLVSIYGIGISWVILAAASLLVTCPLMMYLVHSYKNGRLGVCNENVDEV